ncbi:MAG: hypothetical protein RBG13Loki_1598, partial [Promethearchaeota archaeon CR_4]
GTKGLEGDIVIIPEIDLYWDTLQDRQRLYVGMTRAVHKLVLTATRATDLTRQIKKIINPPSNF